MRRGRVLEGFFLDGVLVEPGDGAQPLAQARVYAALVRPRYPARNPTSASRPDSVNTGRIVATAVEADGMVVLIRHLLQQPEPPEAGPPQAPALNHERNLCRAHAKRQTAMRMGDQRSLQIAEYGWFGHCHLQGRNTRR
jgi:hypothetical protein